MTGAPNPAALVAAVRAYALANIRNYSWAEVAENWSDDAIAAAIAGATTPQQAIGILAEDFGGLADHGAGEAGR